MVLPQWETYITKKTINIRTLQPKIRTPRKAINPVPRRLHKDPIHQFTPAKYVAKHSKNHGESSQQNDESTTKGENNRVMPHHIYQPHGMAQMRRRCHLSKQHSQSQIPLWARLPKKSQPKWIHLQRFQPLETSKLSTPANRKMTQHYRLKKRTQHLPTAS